MTAGDAPGANRLTALLAMALLALVAGCSGVLELGSPPGAEGPPPALGSGCEAESYDFIGEGTLAGLGLDDATPVPPPEPNRPAMIWVTHDLLPYDRGAPGGPVKEVRMLCFEFADGSGGSEWPVDPAWQPPGAASTTQVGDRSEGWLPVVSLVAVGVVLVAGASVLAFRRRC